MAKLPELIRTAPHVERRIHAALAEEREKPSDRDGRLGMSQLGQCERNLWASLRGVPVDKPIEPRILLLFDHGNAVESHVIANLRKAGFVLVDRDEHGNQFRYEDFGGRLVGHIDGKIELGTNASARETCLLEIKSANAKKFDELEAVGYEAWNPVYAAQLHTYMGYARLADSLALVYNKNTSQLYCEKIRFNPSKFKALVAKAARIITSDKTLPRPAEAKSQYCAYCKWCDRNAWCWGPLADVKFAE